MKYIEEINPGDTFTYNDKMYLLTCDFNKNGKRMAISFDSGFPSWFSAETIIDSVPIFKLDKDNNIIPVKHVLDSSKSIS